MDITADELRQKLASGQPFVFFDVREPWETEDFSLGAAPMPIDAIPTRLAELDDRKEAEIIVHCHSGQRGAMVRGLFEAHGFTNVRNLTGGVLAWKEAFGAEKPVWP